MDEIEREFNKLVNDPKNWMDYWFPKVPKDIPQPRTLLIEVPKDICGQLFGEGISDKAFINGCFGAGDLIGYPLFIRTGSTSDKHDYIDTCYVPNKERLMRNVANLLYETMDREIMLGNRMSFVLAFREFIPLKSPFKAFHGLPIAKERRYFVRNKQVECHHPYWMPDAILSPTSETWEKELMALNEETPREIKELTVMAEKSVERLEHDYWSVDFAQDINGKWWLIDMAFGEASYHWSDCRHVPEYQRRSDEKRAQKKAETESKMDEWKRIAEKAEKDG